MKLCECGCGLPAPIAKITAKRLGHIKGEPVRFRKGHWMRTATGEKHPQWKGGRITHSPNGYVRIMLPGHPRANDGGYVLEHIAVAEKVLGRPLPDQAEVHHFNEVKSDNSNKNLVICEDRSYHFLLHARLNALRACGNPEARQCWICREWDPACFRGQKNASFHTGCFQAYKSNLPSQNRKRRIVCLSQSVSQPAL